MFKFWKNALLNLQSERNRKKSKTRTAFHAMKELVKASCKIWRSSDPGSCIPQLRLHRILEQIKLQKVLSFLQRIIPDIPWFSFNTQENPFPPDIRHFPSAKNEWLQKLRSEPNRARFFPESKDGMTILLSLLFLFLFILSDSSDFPRQRSKFITGKVVNPRNSCFFIFSLHTCCSREHFIYNG